MRAAGWGAMVILIFGATGSAGGGVLQACLETPAVTEIRAIARRPLAVAHPKLRVVQHQAFDDYSAIADAFAGSTRVSTAWASRRRRSPARPSIGA